MSTLVGSILIRVQAVHPEISGPTIASSLAIICGAIVAFLGFLRLGFIVDFIPLPAITAFMTGSAINVCAGQVKTVLGENAHFSTRGATFKVIVDTLKHLPSTQMDATMGLTALAMLYAIRSACNYGSRKKPHKAKVFFFLSTLRTAFVVLFYTMISAAVNIHRRDHPAFKLLGNVPRGFKVAGVPKIDIPIIKAFMGELPAAVIVLLIEHIAISKSFGRVNNYTIDPSQEFIAIGISNLLGPFLGAYPATGSFSRTAIKAKCGVRTPLAGVITAIVVLLAIYALPALFFYIPKSSLSAVIIHAVGDLITPPSVTYQFWRVSPIDTLIFLMGVIVIIFSTIETGIYCTICVSLAVLLFRTAKARGHFLGYVQIHSVVGDHLLDGTQGNINADFDADNSRRVWLPTSRHDGTNPYVKVHQPAPGIFVYRVSDGFNYPNANHYTDHLVKHIFKMTRRTDPEAWEKPGDRPWNDPGPTRAERKLLRAQEPPTTPLPTLRAVILDFSAVNNVDVTSCQTLIDVRNQLDRWASPNRVQWHFAHVNNKWTRRALAAAGFGISSSANDGTYKTKAIFDVAEIVGDGTLPISSAQSQIFGSKEEWTKDPEIGIKVQETSANTSVIGATDDDIHVIQTGTETVQAPCRRGKSSSSPGITVVDSITRPHFHIDLTSALRSAMSTS
jgi:sodium-independent sulfate anion transporter 11